MPKSKVAKQVLTILESLNFLVSLGVIKKQGNRYKDTAFSGRIDKMGPRTAFLAGAKRGYNLGIKERRKKK